MSYAHVVVTYTHKCMGVFRNRNSLTTVSVRPTIYSVSDIIVSFTPATTPRSSPSHTHNIHSFRVWVHQLFQLWIWYYVVEDLLFPITHVLQCLSSGITSSIFHDRFIVLVLRGWLISIQRDLGIHNLYWRFCRVVRFSNFSFTVPSRKSSCQNVILDRTQKILRKSKMKSHHVSLDRSMRE